MLSKNCNKLPVKTKLILMFLAITCALGCSDFSVHGKSGSIKKEYVDFTCVAHKYLERNGYLDQIIEPESDKIDLTIYDKFETLFGDIDMQKLLQKRYKSMSNKLYGVRKLNDQYHDRYRVYYRIEKNLKEGIEEDVFECLSIDAENKEVRFIEGYCEVKDDIILISERDLSC